MENTWIKLHQRSEALASQAEAAKRQGEPLLRYSWLYAQAGDWEELALDELNHAEQPKTTSITAVSAAALYFKGQEFEKSKAIVSKWIESPHIYAWAKNDLSDILETIEKIHAVNNDCCLLEEKLNNSLSCANKSTISSNQITNGKHHDHQTNWNLF
jgi:hypothetical protein